MVIQKLSAGVAYRTSVAQGKKKRKQFVVISTVFWRVRLSRHLGTPPYTNSKFSVAFEHLRFLSVLQDLNLGPFEYQSNALAN